MVVVEWIS